MKSCKGCIHENLESQDCMHCSRAYTDEYARKEKQTNAERIRSMTDEELMEFLKKIEVGDIDYSVTFCDLCKDGGNALGLDCDECLLHWLQSECEDFEEKGHEHE
ncbi:hypothetical protein [[Clostridium] symbiosum]|uniref:Uncharacterized protein n=1 Tax=Clostridium symbiosum TaxID=1512 RepID=A0AAW6AXB2_CLOSY|nr:hypothetical protein [[Clostridium] symbiosum]MCB6351158.1 hypothetical protein [[Clostridium] symbiosum]MDB1979324.1 hypothetical protein [[Clostridium] symbiosum]MDB1983206.1 hypothetical protein [[Clostridium] symbiosum]MDB1988444.1 hypothetical protein [[Clostridium] symbiosum]MDB1992918.1 hypothetical protein [[Clostridium] symbiosum]